MARIWDQSGSCILRLEGHDAAVKAVRFLPGSDATGDHYAWTASQDQTVRLWKIHSDDQGSKTAEAVALGREHDASVESLDIDISGQLVMRIIINFLETFNKYFPTDGHRILGWSNQVVERDPRRR